MSALAAGRLGTSSPVWELCALLPGKPVDGAAGDRPRANHLPGLFLWQPSEPRAQVGHWGIRDVLFWD